MHLFGLPRWRWRSRTHLPTWVRSLGREDPLEEGTATLSSIFAGESLGQRSPAGYCPGGRQEPDSGTQSANPQPARALPPAPSQRQPSGSLVCAPGRRHCEECEDPLAPDPGGWLPLSSLDSHLISNRTPKPGHEQTAPAVRTMEMGGGVVRKHPHPPTKASRNRFPKPHPTHSWTGCLSPSPSAIMYLS